MDVNVEAGSAASQKLANLGVQALEDLYKSLAGAKEFVLAQAPDVCREIVAWQIAKGVLAVIGWLIFVAIVVVLARYTRTFRDENGDHVAFIMICIFGSVISVVTMLVAVAPAVVFAVQAWVAPKLVIMQTIHDMLKQL